MSDYPKIINIPKDWQKKILPPYSIIEKKGTFIRTIEFEKTYITTLAITTDCKTVVVPSRSYSLVIWDIESDIQKHVLVGHENLIYSIALTSDDKFVVSASVDSLMIVWCIRTGHRIWDSEYRGHKVKICEIVITRDDKNIISASDDNTIIIWDFSSGKKMNVILGVEKTIFSVNILSDCKTIVAGSNSKIVFWDLLTCEQKNTFEGHNDIICSLAITRDNSRLISGSFDRTLIIWEILTGKILHKIYEHKARLSSVKLSIDENYIFSSSFDKTVKVWNITTGEKMSDIQFEYLLDLYTSPDGQYMLVGDYSGFVYKCNISSLPKPLLKEWYQDPFKVVEEVVVVLIKFIYLEYDI